MNLSQISRLFYLCVILFLYWFLPEQILRAQDPVKNNLPEGESVGGDIAVEGESGYWNVHWTSTEITIQGQNTWHWGVQGAMRIKKVAPKTNRPGRIYVLLESTSFLGSPQVLTVDISGGFFKVIDVHEVTFSGGSQSSEDIQGDALYMLSTLYLYVSRDSASTWSLDTAGLKGTSINGISLDTSQYVYAATTNGVFKQHPDSNVWHQITNLPTSNYQSILVDRRNKIFAANYVNYNGKGTYVSTDNGTSWTLDSAGIGIQQILRLSDDAYGNTYAIANGYNQIYQHKNNTPGWTRIEGGITAITINTPTINSIGGDSVLYAATSFGLYSSTDQGTTWVESNAGIPASTFWSFAKSPGGKWFTATNLAMYSLSPTDTAWTKVYPTSGYQAQLPIYTDGLGNIYTFGVGNNNSFLPLYKSTNNGTSWNADTLGKFIVPAAGHFFIDEKGGQHASYDPYSGIAHLYTKPYGGSWEVDTNGFQTTSANSYSSTAVIASDRRGYLYASGTYLNGNTKVGGQVIRRPIDGGMWEPDTVGLFGYKYLVALVPGKNGDMFGVYHSNLVHRSSTGTWSNLNAPVLTGSTISSMRLSVDSSGALFVSVLGYDANNVLRGLGVYFSIDTGATWKFAGGDSIQFTQLVSYGDSTFGCSNVGLYIFTRKTIGTFVLQPTQGIPMNYILFQNYPNPFNPTTTINYQLPTSSFVTLNVYDVLGREVATLVNGLQEAGVHDVQFTMNNEHLSSGVYIYSLKAGNFTAAKKLLLLK